MKLYCITSALLLSIVAHAQSSFDSVLQKIRNEDLRISVIMFSTAEMVGTDEEKKARAEIALLQSPKSRSTPFITSYPDSIDSLSRSFCRSDIIISLFNLLNDEERDLYAHALLTDLFFPKQMWEIFFTQFEDWGANGKKEKIQRNWEVFLRRGGYFFTP